MTTPRQVRAEIRRRGLPYTVHKDSGCWYVWGPDCEKWYETSLNTYQFDGQPASWWVDIIAGMAAEHRQK